MKRAAMTTWASFFAGMLLAGTCPARAQEDATASSVGGEARYVHQAPGGPTQGFVREYDGHSYDVGEFDLFLRTGWQKALLDLDLGDLHSTNERGSLAFSWGSAVNVKSEFSILTHREPFLRNGLIINGFWTPNPNVADQTAGSQLAFKRNFQKEEIVLALPSLPGLRFFAGNWLEQERGNRPTPYYKSPTIIVYQQNIDRFTRENNFGLDLDIADKGKIYYEYAFRKFVDYAQTPSPILAIAGKSPWNVADQDVNTNKLAFRYNPSRNLSLAMGASVRERDNKFNGLTQYNYSGNLSAAYQPSKDLALSARLYEHSTQVRNNSGFNGVSEPGNIDFLFLKADVNMRYTGLPGAALTAAYKPELTHRSGTENWAEKFSQTANIVYQDVTLPAGNLQVNRPAGEDTKHNFQAGMTIDFPKDVQLELGERYLIANRSAYENSPTLSNEPSATLTVPLPQRLYWTGSFTEATSENQRASFTNFKSKSDTFLTGLNWSEAKGRCSLDFNYAFEEGTDRIDAWFGTTTGTAANPNIHELGAPYKYQSHVLSGNAMVRPLAKLRLNGSASYTDSQGSFLTKQVFDPYFTLAPGNTLDAFNPTDVRILRLGIIARYELNKYLTARAGFRHESWVDRLDSTNDGKDDIVDLGINARF